MARELNAEVQDLINSGQATKRKDNKFGKRVRNVDQDPWEKGDVFVIPANYVVLEAPITKGGDPVPFIMVTVKNKHTNAIRNMRLFPNQFAKGFRPFVNDELQAKVKTKGTAAVFYQQYCSEGDDGMDKAIAAMVGHEIEVTNKTPYTILEYGTDKPVMTSLYQYDWVGAGPQGQQGVVGA